jgi:hypothetical protein
MVVARNPHVFAVEIHIDQVKVIHTTRLWLPYPLESYEFSNCY